MSKGKYTNVVKLLKIGQLGTVRQRLGSEGPEDESMGGIINNKSNHDLVNLYAGWHLGDGTWWDDFKSMFDKLEQLDKDD